MRRWRKRYVVLALVGHVVVLFVSDLMPPSWKATRHLRKPRVVKVRIQPAPPKGLTVAPPASRSPPRPSPQQPQIPGGRPPPQVVPVPAPAPPRGASPRLEDLLPGATWNMGGDGGEDSDAGGGTGGSSMPPALRVETDLFSGKIDVPLVFRERNATAKAVAKIVRQDDGRYVFEYVDGDPLLRAVLFESMRTKDALAQVQKLLAQLETHELVVVLRQIVVQGGKLTGETLESFTVSGNKLTIARTFILGVDLKGVVLPDEEAKRARRRDAAHLEKLKSSPAYVGPLRQRAAE